MFKLTFFVPSSHLETVKEAVFATGAGRIGNYEACCFQTLGQGQFRPMPEANPYIGHSGELSRVEEHRVELVCADEFIQAAVSALRQSHPYEEPAFDVYRVEDF